MTTEFASSDADVFAPRSESELASFLRDRQTPVNIQGGGTRAIGDITHATVLSTHHLTGIKTYEPGALTLVAAAGTPLEVINAALAEENQRLAFEPIDYRKLLGHGSVSTIGGVVASNSSGPRRIQVGAARDFTLGLRFVDGRGAILKNGGRVMKNVTGYDLVKLISGSWGTLGVLTEVSLKVLPNAERSGTLEISIDDFEQGVKVMSAALGSPYDVTGAACMYNKAYIRVEGFDASVGYRLEQLKDLLAANGQECGILPDDTIWRDLRDVSQFADKNGDVWRVSVKPTDGPKVAAALPGDCYLDWGGGLVWACVPNGTDVRAKIKGISGHATRVRGQGPNAFPPQDAAIAALSLGVKKQFDPKGILNSGRMG